MIGKLPKKLALIILLAVVAIWIATRMSAKHYYASTGWKATAKTGQTLIKATSLSSKRRQYEAVRKDDKVDRKVGGSPLHAPLSSSYPLSK